MIGRDFCGLAKTTKRIVVLPFLQAVGAAFEELAGFLTEFPADILPRLSDLHFTVHQSDAPGLRPRFRELALRRFIGNFAHNPKKKPTS